MPLAHYLKTFLEMRRKMTLSMRDLIFRNKKIYHDLHREFLSIFDVGLIDYWDDFTGFDITKFDDEVIKSLDGVMADAVKEKYGDVGIIIIEKLITPSKYP